MKTEDKDKLGELIKRYLSKERLTNEERLFIAEKLGYLKEEICEEIIGNSPDEFDLLAILILDISPVIKTKAAEKMLALDNISDYHLVFLTNHGLPPHIENQAFEKFRDRYPDNTSSELARIVYDPCGFKK